MGSYFLVRDTGDDVMPRSIQLIVGRVAQQNNQKKKRKGAFWEDRNHATAIDSGEHRSMRGKVVTKHWCRE